MNELVFVATQEADGGFVAQALGDSIITQAYTWDELRSNMARPSRRSTSTVPCPSGCTCT